MDKVTNEVLYSRQKYWSEIDDSEKLLDQAVDTLLEGKVIGWFHGRFEWGPRALGNRSILADPRSNEIKDLLNARVKFLYSI